VRWALIALVTSSVAVAAPPKPVRKPPPAGIDKEQLSSYVEAILKDKEGDLDGAVSRYQRIKDLPPVMYNMADLERRMENYERAVELYKKYLELAPNAPDRAAVQKLIDQLQKTPTTLVVDGDDLDAVVFIDGKAVGPSPLVTQLADGMHVVDRIGPNSYDHRAVDAKPMKHVHQRGYGNEKTGNVVMSSPVAYSGSWRDGDKQFRMHERFTLPPGRVDTYLFEPGRACSPISFQVPADGVVYVYVDAPRERPAKGTCTPIKVTAQKIAFPKGAK
jgi:tetratricopeptide (TPR) repeat protein